MKFKLALSASALYFLFLFTANAQSTIPLKTLQSGKESLKEAEKVSPALIQIYKGLPEAPQGESDVPYISADLYLIMNNLVRIEASAVSNADLLVTQLESVGGSEISAYKRIVNAWIPISNILMLNELTELRYAEVVYRVKPNVGSANSEADAAMAVAISRTDYCLDGTGIKIGILSDSYDAKGGASAGVASGDLPGAGNPNGYSSPVTVVSDLAGYSDEGRAMAELVHDLAPGAELFFNTAFLGQASFANDIVALANVHQCDVIVDDIYYFEEPFYMDGIIAQACDQVFTQGVPYFSAAGNHGQASYEAPFRDDGSQWHDFDPGAGVDTKQSITVNSGSSVRIVVQWDDPWGTLSSNNPLTDIDFGIYNADGTTLLYSSVRDNIANGQPTEIVGFTAGGAGTYTFTIGIYKFAGPAPAALKWIIYNNGSVVINNYSTPTPNGQSTAFGHANAVGANAVGACYWGSSPAYGTNPPLAEPFSSSGGVQIRFDTNGNAITPVTRNKPEFTGIDGVSNTFFGNGNKFYGTSAAAPNVAAVAALMLQADTTLTPTQIRNMLANSAIDMSTPGFDYLTGAGLVQADSALAQVYASGCSVDSFSLVSGPTLEPGNTTYTVTLKVHYRNNGCSDALMVEGQTFPVNIAGTQNVTLTGIPVNGIPLSVTAKFVNNQSCQLSTVVPFVLPAPPVDCQLSAWSPWSACDTSCGGGTQSRTRTKLVPASNGGAACGALIEYRACNTQPCPVDCQLSAWSPWSACDTSCGGGTQSRTRTILVPASNGGAACGALMEQRSCNTQPCSVETTMSLVSDSGWALSTVVTSATANTYPWPGVVSVPATPTFSLAAIVGQPYAWEHLYAVPGSQVIKAGSGVTYYRRTFELTDHTALSARFRMFVDDDMQIFINGNWIALEDGMGIQNWRTVNHDILFNSNGTVDNPNAGGDPFDYYTTMSLDNIFLTGTNDIVLAIRNRTLKPDVGGFSFRMDLDKSGVPVIKKDQLIPNASEFSMYPNPATESVWLSMQNAKVGTSYTIAIIDLSGKILREQIVSGSSLSAGEEIKVSALAEGIYLLRISSEDQSLTNRFMKK